MTEQERRGKTIAMMANDLLDWFTKNSLTDYLKGFGGMPAACLAIAEHIVTKNNLRSIVVEEAQKEKAKEIYKAVLDLRELMVNNDDALCILRNVESWAKEDGVEVEE